MKKDLGVFSALAVVMRFLIRRQSTKAVRDGLLFLHPLMGPSAAKLTNHFSWCGPKSTARLAADIWDMFSLTALNQPDCAIA
jgi:hypothetical protein